MLPAVYQSARFPNRGFSRASLFLMMPCHWRSHNYVPFRSHDHVPSRFPLAFSG